MADSSNNVKWYLAELVEEIKIDGEDENIVHNDLVLIHAESPEEAYKKAMARGSAINDTYEMSPGKKVISTFRGLSDLNPILDELEDGATIAYEELTDLTEEEISEMVPEKDELQRRAKRLNHINSSFLAWEEDTRNAETSPAHPEW